MGTHAHGMGMAKTTMVSGTVVVVDGLRMVVTKPGRDWCEVTGPGGETWKVRREMLLAWM